MQMSVRTQVEVSLGSDGQPVVEVGRTKATVSLDPAERFQSNEWYGSSRRFEVVAFTVQHGAAQSATGSGSVVRKDGSVGTARVSSAAFKMADIPTALLNEVQDRLDRCATAAHRLSTPNGA